MKRTSSRSSSRTSSPAICKRPSRRSACSIRPDPASLKESVIGGNVAECAGGPRAFKYGTTKQYVLGLEVVLPTGKIVRTGGKVVKNVVGYDLTHLIVGSEGTLGDHHADHHQAGADARRCRRRCAPRSATSNPPFKP